MSKKGINYDKMADFSELKDLANRIDLAARESPASKFDRTKLVKSGAYILMNGLIKNTPIATKASNPHGSNWFRYTYNPTEFGIGYSFPRGTCFGDTHYRGTLARGWVAQPNEVLDRPPHRKPTLAEGKVKVNMTPVDRKGKYNYSMRFVNSAPYSMAVEVGHKNKVPRILGGDGTQYYKYTCGRHFTEKTVQEYREKIWNEMGKECTKMIKGVVTSKGGRK